MFFVLFFFFKQKTAYELRISDWSSDVCSSDVGIVCLVALLTLSVSMALTVRVPILANGYLKREDTIPYIAGANITTLADALVAAIVIGNADAVRVVIAEVVGVSAFTLLLLAVA